MLKEIKSIESADWLGKRGERERGQCKVSQVPGLGDWVDGEMAAGSKWLAAFS